MPLIRGTENETEGETEIRKKVLEYAYWIENDMLYIIVHDSLRIQVVIFFFQ